MINVDFGRLDFKKIKYIIYDLDNCLFLYPDGYAEEFSIQTAKSAIKFARGAILNSNDDKKLLELLEMDFDDVVEMAKQSYVEYGCTTTVFKRDYGLDDIRLYQDHHIAITEGIIKPTFQKFARHGLRQGMVMLHNLGIRQHLFTNGTEEYARAATKKLGVDDCMKTHIGIDSYDDIGHPSGAVDKKGKIILFTKNKISSWPDALELMQIPTYVSEAEKNDGIRQFRIGQDKERGETYKYWNYLNTIFIDDSPENLKTAKELGMQTVLLKTDRVDYDEKNMPYIDAVTDNLDVFLCLMAHELEKFIPKVKPQSEKSTASYTGPRLIYSAR